MAVDTYRNKDLMYVLVGGRGFRLVLRAETPTAVCVACQSRGSFLETPVFMT